MISRFFIDRPIFATVLSLAVTLAGFVALTRLPLALYPPISPPVIQVDCNYPGASAETVAEAVAAPIEQEVNGVEGMMYMSSQCTNDGSYNLMVTFHHGIDLNMAQVLVQNRVNLALPKLPDVIKQAGITTRKRPPDILLSTGFYSPDGRYDQLYLSNFALLHVKEELARLPGVSDVTMVGERDYSLRVWVDPQRLAARNLTAGDVVAALREQNTAVAAGQVGQEPARPAQPVQIALHTLGRLQEAEQFENVIVRAAKDGRLLGPRGDHPGDGTGLRPGHCGRSGPKCRLLTVRLHRRRHRPVLPPVCPDDRRQHAPVRVQLVDAVAGADGPAPAAAPQGRIRGPAAPGRLCRPGRLVRLGTADAGARCRTQPLPVAGVFCRA